MDTIKINKRKNTAFCYIKKEYKKAIHIWKGFPVYVSLLIKDNNKIIIISKFKINDPNILYTKKVIATQNNKTAKGVRITIPYDIITLLDITENIDCPISVESFNDKKVLQIKIIPS